MNEWTMNDEHNKVIVRSNILNVWLCEDEEFEILWCAVSIKMSTDVSPDRESDREAITNYSRQVEYSGTSVPPSVSST